MILPPPIPYSGAPVHYLTVPSCLQKHHLQRADRCHFETNDEELHKLIMLLPYPATHQQARHRYIYPTISPLGR
jgi:hypothetical protein